MDKALFLSMLNTLCTIEQQDQTQNESGEITTVWSTKIVNVKCRIQRKGAKEIFSQHTDGQGATGLGEYHNSTYIVYAEKKHVITNKDRVVAAGRIYQIIEAATDSSMNHYQLECKLIES